MSRVKRGNVARKRRKKVLKLAKGFRGRLSKIFRQAKPAVLHAFNFAFRDRRAKKRNMRRLWITRITAALTSTDLNYSVFINRLKKKDVKINRKMLAELTVEHPQTFQNLVQFVK